MIVNATLSINILTAATKPSINKAMAPPVNLPTSNLTVFIIYILILFFIKVVGADIYYLFS